MTPATPPVKSTTESKVVVVPAIGSRKTFGNVILFKTSKEQSQLRFGTPLIELGTPKLGTSWDILSVNLIGEVRLNKYLGTETAEQKPVICVVSEVIVAGVCESLQYSSQIALPLGEESEANEREGTLIGSLNLPNTFTVPGGQTLYYRQYFQVIAGAKEALEVAQGNITQTQVTVGITLNDYHTK